VTRLGCLPYLNVKPLIYPFEHGSLPLDWDLVYATPSKLAKMLADGMIDAAPVSSFACLSGPDLHIVPGICIASEGPVNTVLMLSKVEPNAVRSVAADTSSLSGRALLRIVLAENYGVEPEFVPCEPKPEAMLAEHDAALIIGNPAMLCDKTGLHVTDLGAEWMRLTGLPAVFAVWAGPRASLTAQLVDDLARAKQEGLGRIKEISEEQSAKLGVPYGVCEDYLSSVMRYDLGEREIESLLVFGSKAVEHGLIDGSPEVRIV
jgi:chorismate dehydratase